MEEKSFKIDKKDLKIRKQFPKNLDITTKIHKVKTDYKRSDKRNIIQDALDEMEEDTQDLY